MTWTIDRPHYPKASGRYTLSAHAHDRMCERGLGPDLIRRTLRFGRVVFARGAAIFVVGKKEVARYDALVPDDDGLQAVVTGVPGGTVMTVYRNREDLPRA
jgi:hypothetical protein